MKKKKIIIFAVALLIIIISYFLIDNYFFNKDKYKKYNVKQLHVIYTVTDTNKNDIKIGDRQYEVTFSQEGYIDLKKEGSNYVGFLDNSNKKMIQNIKDYVFAKNNIYGQVIDDASFDEKKLKITIPSKYIKKSEIDSLLRFQLLVYQKDLSKYEIEIKEKRFFSKTRKIEINSYENEVSFSLNKYTNNSLYKDDLLIYVNDNPEPLSDMQYEFDSKMGIISINRSPSLINNIFIKKKKSSILNFVNLIHIFASTNDTVKPQFTLDDGSSKNIPVGTTFSVSAKVYYTTHDAVNGWEAACNNGSKSACNKYRSYSKVMATSSAANGTSHTNDYVTETAAYTDFVVDLSDISTSKKVNDVTYKLNFDSYSYFVLHCTESNKTAGSSGAAQTVTLTVKKSTSDIIVFDVNISKSLGGQESYGNVAADYPEDEGFVKVKKVDRSNNRNVQGIEFRLYTDSECSDSHQIGRKWTNSYGNVTWKGLEKGTVYYFKEIPNQIYTSADCEKCTKIKAKKLDDTDTTTPVSVTCYNDRIKYAFSIKKTDSSNANLGVSGAQYTVYYNGTKDEDTYYYDRTGHTYTAGTAVETTFVANNGSITSDDNGNVTVCGLPDLQDYYVVETGNTNPLYYNDNPDTKYPASRANLTSYTGDCPTPAATVTNPNTPKRWCIKVIKKDKVTNQPVTSSAATFALCADANCTTVLQTKQTNTANGVATFMGLTHDGTTTTKGSPYYVKETAAPEGYAVGSSTPKQVNNVALLAIDKVFSTNEADCTSNPESMIFDNPKLLINWFKENESNDSASTKRADGAKFKVKDPSGKYVRVEGTQEITDTADPAVTKTCYKYKDSVDSASDATEFSSGAISGYKGEVCIAGLTAGEYTVIETQPTQNHTFGSSIILKMQAVTEFYKDKIFTNYPTYIEIEKKVTDADRVSNTLDDTVLKKIETNKLKKIPFEVYKADASGNATGDAISFVLLDGVYHEASSVDVNGTTTTTLYLNDDRRIKLSHLSWGTTGTQQYVLKEKGHKTSDACTCTDDPDCIGYYYPLGEQEAKFTITKCSSSTSIESSEINKTENLGAGTCPDRGTDSTDKNLNNSRQDNTPTELWFTKKDFYSYENSEDIADQTVDFVDTKERSDFDKITFAVKGPDGIDYLKFIDIGKHISDSSNKCLKDDDYHEYRYITDAEINALSETERAALNGLIVTELHTCGGHIRITNLCRGKKYTIRETAVPNNSVFTLPEDNNPREVEYTIPCCDNDTTNTRKDTKTIIRDKGTRVRFEKRDSKYNYLIPDETTTFQVYQCAEGVECHPTDNISDMARATGVRKIMKFKDKAYLTATDLATPLDQEDGKSNGSVIQHTDQLINGDTDYEANYKVYKAVSDSDLSSNNATYVTDLHPDKGILILRYLPAGYNYVLVETVSPKGYMLPDGRKRETTFTITKETVKVEEVNVPNKPVSLLVRKYDNKGNLLEGAEFKISKAKNCNMNVAPNKVETEYELTLKTIRDGVYEVRPTGDTKRFKTCQDRPGALCNDINGTLTHQLYTTETYGNSMGDFSKLITDRSEPVVIEAGEALIQYLDYGACYVIEETKAPDGFSLPENEEDRFVMVKMTDKEQVVDTYDQLVNKPTPFPFYKYDEYNNLLDGGKYKLQKLNKDKIYKDIPVTEVEEDGKLYYKVDPNSENYLMETRNGTATVYYLDEGQYRILEVEAPPGYELPIKTINVATFFVDKDGKVYGSNIIANKPKTEVKEIKPSASAKLVVDIKTGQKVIRYGLIITVIILAIAGLMYVSRKNKEEKDKNEK